MSYYVVDVEADGPIPHKYSMVCFGVVKLTPELDTIFYGKTKPISELWIPEALEISGFNRDEHLTFDDPFTVMKSFKDWINKTTNGNPIFISDNNGFDFAWINYYFHTFIGSNPFGWSSRRIGDMYCGMMKNTYAKWKHLRKTKHTHNPIDDSMGDAQAILEMKKMGLKIKTK